MRPIMMRCACGFGVHWTWADFRRCFRLSRERAASSQDTSTEASQALGSGGQAGFVRLLIIIWLALCGLSVYANSARVLVEESNYTHEQPRDEPPNCYEQPHPVLALFCILLGCLSLCGAGGCWNVSADNTSRQAILGFIGFIPLAASFLFFYEASQLAFFGVAPCASMGRFDYFLKKLFEPSM